MSIRHVFFGVAIPLGYLCLNAGQKEPCPLTTCLGDDDDDDDDVDVDADADGDDDDDGDDDGDDDDDG